MQTLVNNPQTILNDSTLTTEEVLTLMYPNYVTMLQNGRVIKLWQIVVTPDLAKFLLRRNLNNRPLNRSNLQAIKSEILAGRWREVSDPIMISSEDNLINGQHRLSLIIELNVALPLRVETNVDASTFSIIDTGRKRTGVDTLSIKHIENASVTATAIRFINVVMNNFSTNVKLSNQNIVEFVDNNPSIVESVKFGTSYNKKGNNVVSATLLSAFHFLLKDNYKAEGEEFLLKLALGNNIEPNCPSGVLRSKFILLKTEKFKTMRREVLLQYVVLAWNKYISGEKVKSLKLPNEAPIMIM